MLLIHVHRAQCRHGGTRGKDILVVGIVDGGRVCCSCAVVVRVVVRVIVKVVVGVKLKGFIVMVDIPVMTVNGSR